MGMLDVGMLLTPKLVLLRADRGVRGGRGRDEYMCASIYAIYEYKHVMMVVLVVVGGGGAS